MIPENGIYFAKVDVGESQVYGMVSIGVRPTFFDKGERTIETNLLDFEGDLYGKTLTLQFLKRLLDERKFEGAAQLIEQMHLDEQQSRQLAAMHQTHVKE